MSLQSKLKNLKKNINKYAYLHWGVHLFTGTFSKKYFQSLQHDLKELQKQSESFNVKFPITELYPCYEDKKDNAGKLMMHYFYQDIYVAQQIFKNNPLRHIDIGSRIDGFVSHVATFREIEIYDIRTMNLDIPNIKFTQADLMNLDKNLYDCTDSVSSLHAIEHFGLGRYGDPICYDGYLKGFNNITLLLKKGGKFYFSVPMGAQRIEFHAHRVFSIKYLLQLVERDYNIDSFSYINDQNTLHPEVNLSKVTDSDLENSFGCMFGCAIFVLTKKA